VLSLTSKLEAAPLHWDEIVCVEYETTVATCSHGEGSVRSCTLAIFHYCFGAPCYTFPRAFQTAGNQCHPISFLIPPRAAAP
jgi:hypothetical protein